MCGITGIVSHDVNNSNHLSAIKKMNDAIAHRGPNSEGIWNDEYCFLGHRRLSIIDLSETGHQPMCDNTGKIWITFNGEIYNYIELKDTLNKKGHTFKSESDTEVVIAAYKEWGTDCVNQFNGMWAFCIYDKEKQFCFASRDRFGVKPFYYFADSHQFTFASEIKTLWASGVSKSLSA